VVCIKIQYRNWAMQESHFSASSLYIQVSLAIREGYVPEKFGSANTKTTILGLNLWNFPRYSRFSPILWPANNQIPSPRITRASCIVSLTIGNSICSSARLWISLSCTKKFTKNEYLVCSRSYKIFFFIFWFLMLSLCVCYI